MFHTITGAWAALGDPKASGARLGTPWRNGMLWALPGAAGEGSAFAYAQVQPTQFLLGWFDWLIIVVYLVSMLGMGLYFYLREKRASTADFFVGGRSIPFWAAGVSLYAANTSSISYIAIPAKAFETNWQYLGNNLIAVVGPDVRGGVDRPLLRRLNLMSVFHYLESRFHPVIRTLASALFMAVQIGSRMSVILFLPSLAIATITGLEVTWSILIMGVFTIAYTALGGMKAVIWTDFVQLIVKMGGIFFAIGFVVYMLDGGAQQLIAVAQAEHKTQAAGFQLRPHQGHRVGLPVPGAVRRRADLPQGPGADAARAVHQGRPRRRPLHLDLRRHMIPAGVLFYGVGHRAVCVLPEPSRAHEPAADHRRHLPAVHRRRAAGGRARPHHRRHPGRRHGHLVQHHEQRGHAGLGGLLREVGQEPQIPRPACASPRP